jgi:hypothetical protein
MRTTLAYESVVLDLAILDLLVQAQKREGQGIPVRQLMNRLGQTYWIDKFGFRAKKDQGGLNTIKKSSPKIKGRDVSFARTNDQIQEIMSKVAYIDYNQDSPTTSFTDKWGEGAKEMPQWLKERNIEIKEVLKDKDTGFAALSYVKDGEPYIAFRGTDDLKDVLDDIQLPGNEQFEKNKNKIASMIDRISSKTGGKKVSLTGHSLGGALAQIVATELPDQVKSVTTFNAPGISANRAKKFKEANLDSKIKVKHYVKEGDIVTQFGGEKMLEGKVAYKYDISSQNVLNRHRDFITDENSGFFIDEHPNWLKDKTNSELA